MIQLMISLNIKNCTYHISLSLRDYVFWELNLSIIKQEITYVMFSLDTRYKKNKDRTVEQAYIFAFLQVLLKNEITKLESTQINLLSVHLHKRFISGYHWFEKVKRFFDLYIVLKKKILNHCHKWVHICARLNRN